MFHHTVTSSDVLDFTTVGISYILNKSIQKQNANNNVKCTSLNKSAQKRKSLGLKNT